MSGFDQLTQHRIGDDKKYVLGPVILDDRRNRFFVGTIGKRGSYECYWRNGELVIVERVGKPPNSGYTSVTITGEEVKQVLNLQHAWEYNSKKLQCYPVDKEELEELTNEVRAEQERRRKHLLHRRRMEMTGWVRAIYPQLYQALDIRLAARCASLVRHCVAEMSQQTKDRYKRPDIFVQGEPGDSDFFYHRDWLARIGSKVEQAVRAIEARARKGDKKARVSTPWIK